eukprot:1188401-Prorocentrum_minimum.AAC.2
MSFASTLEGFSGDDDDYIGSTIGGPVMIKYNDALREIASFNAVLQTELDWTLCTRVNDFFDEFQVVKDVRKRFDKTSQEYDQVRIKFLSLKKSAPTSVLVVAEKEMMAAKNSFERDRFNLMSSLARVESKRKYEFVEAISNTMEAHLRYFKQSYELLSKMEPYIKQVLSLTQISKEAAEKECLELDERMTCRLNPGSKSVSVILSIAFSRTPNWSVSPISNTTLPGVIPKQTLLRAPISPQSTHSQPFVDDPDSTRPAEAIPGGVLAEVDQLVTGGGLIAEHARPRLRPGARPRPGAADSAEPPRGDRGRHGEGEAGGSGAHQAGPP